VMKRNGYYDGEEVDGIKASHSGYEELVQVARTLEVVLVGVIQNEAGEHEEERDAEVAVLKKDSDWMGHVGAGSERRAKVEEHDPDCREETDSGEGVQTATAYALSGGGNQTFLKQL
jgi:hypothetical protein